jgi:pimeloyl-ACP methyl ester carboxylesterase
MKRDYPTVDLHGYPVQYPADGFGLTNLFPKAGAPKADAPKAAAPKAQAPSAAEIAAHSAIGPKDIVSRIESQTKACPGTKFALVGYSQGGMVVMRAATTLKSLPEVSKNVVAVVLYGAGDGTSVALPPSLVLANCARGDMVSFFYCKGIWSLVKSDNFD